MISASTFSARASRLRLEAIDRLDEDELHVIEAVIDSILLKHEARRYAATA